MNQESAKLTPEERKKAGLRYQAAIKKLANSTPSKIAKGYISKPDSDNPDEAFQVGQALAFSPGIQGVGDDVLRAALILANKAKPADPSVLIQATKVLPGDKDKKHNKR